MMSSGTNLVMTVIGFSVSIMFIVFVCTRLICARIHLNAARRSFARASRSDLGILERGGHGIEPLVVANFPTKKYRELCASSRQNAQCSVCLAEYHEEDTLRLLPVCGHSFHATCIDIWLQQHATCPVCRVSLRELPERKWFMQPMFSSVIRSQHQSVNAHYCHCMANRHSHASRSYDNQIIEHSEGNGDEIGARNSPSGDRNQTRKDLASKGVESPSNQ